MGCEMENITEQCEGERADKKELNSAFWKSLFDVTSEQVMMINTKGKVLFSNKPVFDHSIEEAIGKNIFNIAPSVYAIILQNKLEEVVDTKSKVIFETIIETPKGRKNLELTIDPVYDNEETIQGFSLASIDTTEVKLAKKAYNYKSNLEKLFLTISTKFINLPATEIDNGIRESLELIARFTNSEHAYIFLNSEQANNIAYQWHFNLSLTTEKLCSIQGVEDLIGEVLIKSELTGPRLIKPNSGEFRIHNDCPVFVNPMFLENKRYGALILMGKINAEEGWSEDFAKPMMLFTNVFINTLERKKNALIEEERKDVLEKAIKERTIEIEIHKNKLIKQADDLKQAEILVIQANNELKKANARLENTVSQRTSSLQKTNQELDRFVYSVSHDIKAPLASVQGLINLIRLSSEDELEHILELMEKSIDKLNGFVEDILVHSRNARVAVKKDVINFDEEIELAAQGLRHMDKASKVKLITSIKESSPAVSDQYRLQSVLKNLISNSVKYHNPDAKKSWVKVHAESNKKEILIKVSDNGIGINEHNVDKVFDMFYRASENSFGSGLGLYIVKETVEKLGGTISVTSKEKVGTSFDLAIPNLA